MAAPPRWAWRPHAPSRDLEQNLPRDRLLEVLAQLVVSLLVALPLALLVALPLLLLTWMAVAQHLTWVAVAQHLKQHRKRGAGQHRERMLLWCWGGRVVVPLSGQGLVRMLQRCWGGRMVVPLSGEGELWMLQRCWGAGR